MNLKFYFFILVLVVTMSLNVRADRNPPAKIPPIVFEKHIFSQKFEKDEVGFRVYILSSDLKSQKVEWKTEIYHGTFDQGLETDVQEVYLASLKLQKKKLQLEAVDESGKKYLLDSVKGKLLEPSSPGSY